MESRADASYPVQFDVTYPDRDLNRLSTGFRIFAAIPIILLAATIGGHAWAGAGTVAAGGFGGLLFLPVLLVIVFRQKYPRGGDDWNLQLMRFSNRVGVYLAPMGDRYPPTDEEPSVRRDFPSPDP